MAYLCVRQEAQALCHGRLEQFEKGRLHRQPWDARRDRPCQRGEFGLAPLVAGTMAYQEQSSLHMPCLTYPSDLITANISSYVMKRRRWASL